MKIGWPSYIYIYTRISNNIFLSPRLKYYGQPVARRHTRLFEKKGRKRFLSERYRVDIDPSRNRSGAIGSNCTRLCLVSCNVMNRCHPYAQCIYVTSTADYECRCNPGYEGDGMECIKTGTFHPHLRHLLLIPVIPSYYRIWWLVREEKRENSLFTCCLERRGVLFGSGHLRPERVLPARGVSGQVRVQSRIRGRRNHVQPYRSYLISFVFFFFSSSSHYSFLTHPSSSSSFISTQLSSRFLLLISPSPLWYP